MMNKGRFSKWIVIFCIAQILIFTYICLFVSMQGAMIPDALVYGFFAVFGLELGGCAFIKHSRFKFTNTGVEEQYEEYNKEVNEEDA